MAVLLTLGCLASGCAVDDATHPAGSTIPVAAVAAADDGAGPSGSSLPSPPSTRAPVPFAATSTTTGPAVRAVAAPACALPVGDVAVRPAGPVSRSVEQAGQVTGQVPEPTTSTTSTSSTVPSSSSSTSTSTSTTQPPPPTAAAALDRLRNDPRVAGNTIGVSVWIDGLGEVAALNPDAPLVPASNQKLLTALGALRLLDPQERLHTELFATGPVVDGVLEGDLVLVGGGDPTLTLTGEHGLSVFVRAVADAGVREVDGRVLVDDSRYDDVRRGQAWPDDWATYAGPMSALVADRNRYRQDDAFRRDPAVGHGEVLRFGLVSAGIGVRGGVEHTVLTSGMRLAVLDSPTIGELVTIMLFRSDNLFAELLLKEIGFRATRRPGTSAAGLDAIRGVLDGLCLTGPLGGVDVDGSGLSYDDRKTARGLRRLLLGVLLQPWGAEYLSTLSVAGTPDAIGGRLVGPRTSGNVRAKGGSLSISRSLSGYLSTASGRHAVFSVIVNGPRVGRAEEAIDEFVTNLASLVT